MGLVRVDAVDGGAGEGGGSSEDIGERGARLFMVKSESDIRGREDGIGGACVRTE